MIPKSKTGMGLDVQSSDKKTFSLQYGLFSFTLPWNTFTSGEELKFTLLLAFYDQINLGLGAFSREGLRLFWVNRVLKMVERRGHLYWAEMPTSGAIY